MLADPSLILLIQPQLIVGDPILLVICPLLLVQVLISTICVGSVSDLLLLILLTMTIVVLLLFKLQCKGSVLSSLGHGSLLEQLVLQVGVLRLVVFEQGPLHLLKLRWSQASASYTVRLARATALLGKVVGFAQSA